MDRSPPNPYSELRLRELRDVLSARAGDLLEGRPVGRRDIAYLLIVAANRIDPKPFNMGSPVYRTRQRSTDLASAFWEFYQEEALSLRYWVIRRALDMFPSLVPGTNGYDPVLYKGFQTEAGMKEVLERFGRDLPAALREGERLPGRPPPEPAPG